MVVGEGGFEPPLRRNWFLRPARLPFRHSPMRSNYTFPRAARPMDDLRYTIITNISPWNITRDSDVSRVMLTTSSLLHAKRP
jgi:hypothetical protein